MLGPVMLKAYQMAGSDDWYFQIRCSWCGWCGKLFKQPLEAVEQEGLPHLATCAPYTNRISYKGEQQTKRKRK